MGGSASTEWSTSEISGSGADTDGSPRCRPRRSCPVQTLKSPFALILHSSQGESKPLPLKIVHALRLFRTASLRLAHDLERAHAESVLCAVRWSRRAAGSHDR